MKRLPVRLSVIAVVLAIGSYAVFQTVTWRNKSANASEPVPQTKSTPPTNTKPIPDESSDLPVPPSDAFERTRFPVIKASQNEITRSDEQAPNQPPAPTFGGKAQNSSSGSVEASTTPPSPSFNGGDSSTFKPLPAGNYSLSDGSASADGVVESTGVPNTPNAGEIDLNKSAPPVVDAASLRREFEGADPPVQPRVIGVAEPEGRNVSPTIETQDALRESAASQRNITPPTFAPLGGSGNSRFGDARTEASTLRQPVTQRTGFGDPGAAFPAVGAAAGGAGVAGAMADRAVTNPGVGTQYPPPSNVQSNPYVENRSPYSTTTAPGSRLAGGASPLSNQVAFASVPTPGPRNLEGAQSPTVVIEKTAPGEIQVGRPATFDIRVKNTGSVTAHQVMVVDQIPTGTELMDATPPPMTGPDGSLVWQIGTLEPNDEVIITLELLPQQEGEVGSVAQVLFHAQASVRTICTRPQLKIEQNSPRRVLIGESMGIDIVLSNSGSGAAESVVMESDIPEGLSHPAGSQLEKNVGQIRPGETKRYDLQLTADKPGLMVNRIVVRNEDKVVATHEIEVEVIAPAVDVGLSGPTRRYLQRKATYTVAVANPGTAPAQNLELIAYLPKGMKFIETGNQGSYDPQNHAIFWNLVELPPGSQGEVHLTVLPIEAGAQKIRIEGRGDLGIEHFYEHNVSVESVAELAFTIADSADPIEVGTETVYVVEVVNDGTKPDSNIRLGAELPNGLRPVRGDGPTAGVVQGQAILFEPLGRLDSGQSATYKITAVGTAKGDHVIRVGVVSDGIPVPVAKEERTHVYADH